MRFRKRTIFHQLKGAIMFAPVNIVLCAMFLSCSGSSGQRDAYDDGEDNDAVEEDYLDGEFDVEEDVEPDGDLDVEDGDAVEPFEVERLDWTDARGDPLETASLGQHAGQLFGVTAGSVILKEGRFDETCTLRWLDVSGNETVSMEARPLFIDRYSTHDSQWLLLLKDITKFCMDDMGFPIYQSDISLISADSGAVTWSLDGIFSYLYTGSSFSGLDRWIRLSYSTVSGCGGFLMKTDEFASFSDTTEIFPCDMFYTYELSDGRWLVVTVIEDEQKVALLDPHDPGSLQVIHENFIMNPLVWKVSDEHVHLTFKTEFGSDTWHLMYYSIPDERVIVYDHPESMDFFDYSGRWVLVCETDSIDPLVDCFVHDVNSEYDDVPVDVYDGGRTIVLNGESDTAYYVGVTAEGEEELYVIKADLITGKKEAVLQDYGELYSFSNDNRAVFENNDNELWLVDERGAVMLAENVLWWWRNAARSYPFPGEVASDHVILIVSETSPLLPYRFSMWNDTTGRLVQITDRLYFDRNRMLRYNWECNPGVVKTVDGRPAWDGSFIYFGELQSGDEGNLTMHIMPIDLSWEPRALHVIPIAACHPPAMARDGGRAAVMVKEFGDATGELVVGAGF